LQQLKTVVFKDAFTYY